MQGDGVYSRFVPSLPTGKFSVTIFVEGTIGQYSFSRHVRLGVVNVVAPTPATDAISPSRIVDFRMAFLPGTPNKISFTWTAPGDDYDFGTADRYMVKVGSTPDLEHGEFSYLEDWPAPLESGAIQQHTAEWTSYDTVSYVGIYAIDKDGNTPALSNLVSVYIPSPPTTTPAPSLFFQSVYASNSSAVRDGNGTPLMAVTNLKLIIIIAGCIVGLLVFCALAYCVCVAQKPKNKKSSDIPSTFNGEVVIPNEKKFSDRTDSNESIKKEFISPVESWSASQLLSSHQENKRGSVSARSDGTSDHSDSTKKSYTGYSANNDFYGNPSHFQYNHGMYPENYPPPSTDSYPTPTEGYPTPTDVYPPEGYPMPSETRSYVSSPPSESFLSVSCDLIPGTHGPPGYSAYPPYDTTTLRSGKVPPPIPPKPKVMYSPEPYQFDSQDSSSGSPSIVGAEKRVRNVTMV